MGVCCANLPEDSNELDNTISRKDRHIPDNMVSSSIEKEMQEDDWEQVIQIWNQYDEDDSGKLEKEEAFEFLKLMLKQY